MKNVITRTLTAALIILGFTSQGTAGNWTNFSNYSQATSMAKRYDELWMSDKSGLMMYNTISGVKTNFDKGPNALPSLTIERVRVHPQTMDIWIGTYDNGMAMLHNGTWTHIPFPAADAMLYEMQIAPDGTVWSATTEGVYKYQNGTFTLYLTNNSPWDIDLMPNGKLLCGHHEPFIFDPADQSIQTLNSSVFAYGFSRVIAKDDHHFFFSSDHGELAEFIDTTEIDTLEVGYARDMQFKSTGNLLLLDEQNILHEKAGAYCNTISFGNNILTTFLALPNDEMWGASTENANTLFHYNTQGQTIETDIRKCGLNDNWVSRVHNSADGNVLIVNNSCIQKFDLATQAFTTIPVDSTITMSINDVLETNGKLYVGTSYKYFYEYTTANGWQQRGNGILPHAEVKKMDVDAQGNLWICGYGYVAKYDGSNFTVYDNTDHYRLTQYMRDIHCDKTRNLVWFCSYDGVFKIDNGVVSFYNDSTAGIQQYYDAIETIAEDDAHNIWFGAVYGGLLKYDGSNFSSMILPEHVGNQFVSDIAFIGSTMYVSDNLHGVYVYENAQWDSLNKVNSAITDNFVSTLNVDASGNLWIGHLGHGVDVYNKNGVILSVSEPYKNTLNLVAFPNPSSGKINLQWQGNGSATVTVYSIDGKEVVKQIFAENTATIDLNNNTPGLYIAEVKTNTSTQRVKVLVQ